MAHSAAHGSKDPKSTSAFFQLSLIAINTIILSSAIYIALSRFNSLDTMPQLLPITPEKLSDFGGTPTTVNIGLFIKDFPEFDMTKNEFIFSGTISFEFDPALASLETLGKFNISRGEIQYISQPITSLVDGKVFARYDIRVKFKTNLNFSLFPIADQTVYIILDNNNLTPGEIIFDARVPDFVTSPGISISDWKEHDKSVYTGYSVAQLEEGNKERNVYHPRAVFAIDYKRVGTRQILTILLPLVLIFFISIFSFSVDPDKYYASIISLSTGAVTALVAYRFVIENLSPKVGYFMVSDMLFLLYLAIVFLIFFINTFVFLLGKTSKQILTIALHVLVLTLSIYFVDFWLR